jgi:hypothetical protein
MPTVDPWSSRKFVEPTDDGRGPFSNGQAVTQSDTTDMPNVCLALYVGSAGSLAINLPSGSPLTFAAVPAGTTIPVRASRVLATGTSAGSIVALW